ncbi:hypothetical protein I6E74_06230 [Salinibacterium sp. SWN139]|uniref:hypothetical protein n=1 Tax=Salinibacterium sp. SWN139 TaxID=2792055 RepID=UPI0018CF8D3A|nr:hypothetical protein [Salinibacterium sp. SWN139]MBH0053768.1 hypothetical protein [Salinibacterium sp. SWN139]
MYMIEPALVELGKILSAPSTGDGDKLRAISMVLDRTGYGKGMTVEHTQSKPWEVTMEHILTEVPEARQHDSEQIEDAVVIEDTSEETFPPVEPLRPEFDGPRIGPINGGDGGILSYGKSKMNNAVEHPSRGNRDE